MPEDVNQLPHPGVVFIRMSKPVHELVSSAVWRKDGDDKDIVSLVEVLKEMTEELR